MRRISSLGAMVAEVERVRTGNDSRRIMVGLVGPPGSGKSTIAGLLVTALADAAGPAVHVPMDGFHLSDAVLDRLGRRDRKGAVDTFDADGYLALLRRIAAAPARTVYAPSFDRSLEQPLAAGIAVDPAAAVVVTEGNYLLQPEPPWTAVRALLAAVWYCDLDDAIRRERLVTRHVGSGKTRDDARRWVAVVDEPNAAAVRARREAADALVDTAAILTRDGDDRPSPRPGHPRRSVSY